MDQNATPGADQAKPKWQPIGAIDRRVAGALAEKAKTTPDAYPMSLNAICNACNQKSNRFPLMSLDADDVEQSLERLREAGAVGIIEGYGRVAKFRHYLYEWLGVDKVELAVMAELLLRGAQTVGELRARASRMEPIADLAALQPILAALKSRGLVIPLTPEGRGHVVTHGLYTPAELEKLRAEYAGRSGGKPVSAPPPPAAEATPPPPQPVAETPSAPTAKPAATVETEIIKAIRKDMEQLLTEVTQLRSEIANMLSEQERIGGELRGLKDSLGE